MSSSALSLVGAGVLGLAAGAALVYILHHPEADEPALSPDQAFALAQQQLLRQPHEPRIQMHSMPMQAIARPITRPSSPMVRYGGAGLGQPSGLPPTNALYAQTAGASLYGYTAGPGQYMQPPIAAGMPLPSTYEQEITQSQRIGRQVEAEFENTVPSMEDLVRLREEQDLADLNTSPADVLEMLSQGNVRFWTGQSTRPQLNAMQRRAEIWQSYPKVAIIGCSDSRVPPEIIFDLGLGDVFVIRVAGNASGSGVSGSILYAVTHLRVKVVLVLGHEGCGIIRTSQKSLDEIDQEPPELATWFKTVRRGIGLEINPISDISDVRAKDREAVIRNISYQVRHIKSNPHIARRVATGELLIAGAFYEKRSGMVDFIRAECDVSPHLAPRGNRGIRAEEEPPIPSIQAPA